MWFDVSGFGILVGGIKLPPPCVVRVENHLAGVETMLYRRLDSRHCSHQISLLYFWDKDRFKVNRRSSW